MVTTTFIYQSRFEVNRPPTTSATLIPAIFSQAADVPPPLKQPRSDASFVFTQPVNTTPTPPSFSNSSDPACKVAASVPLTGFVSLPIPIVSYGFGDFPDLIPSLRQAMPFTGFVRAQEASVATPSALSFSSSPDPTRRIAVPIPFIGFVPPAVAAVAISVTSAIDSDVLFNVNIVYQSVFYAPAVITAAVVTFSPILGQSPDPVRIPSLLATSAGFVSGVPTRPITLSFSQWPEQFLRSRRPELDQYSFVSAFRAPFIGNFIQSPEQFKRSFQPIEPSSFTALQIAYTPGSLTGFGGFPDLIGRLALPANAQPGFVAPQQAPITFSFAQAPEVFRRPVILDALVPFVSTFVIAGTPAPFGFSQWPEQFRLPALAQLLNLNTSGFVFIPTVAPTPAAFGFSQSPVSTLRARGVELDSTNYSFVSAFRIAATPGPLSFTASPEQFKLPRAALEAYSFAALQVVYTPTALVFSQWPEQFKAPRSASLENYSSFVSTFRAPSFGSFIQSPTLFKQPFQPLESSTFTALRIAYTPDPVSGFGQFPDLIGKPPLPANAVPGFVFLPTTVTTPSVLGFSQWPEQFARPRQPGLDGYSFVSAFRATSFGSFIQQPALFRQPFQPFEPSAFTALQIAYTPTPLTFSQAPEQFAKPRQPGLDTYSFVSGFPTRPVTISFSPSPEQFLRPRFAFEEYTFTALQIAYTPSVFGFSESPVRFLSPRWPGLDTYSFAQLQIAYTPGPLVFSQAPERFLLPRLPLEQYTFTALQIAYTPSEFGFSQAPEQFKLPTLAQVLNTGLPGFVFVPTVAQTPTEFEFSQWPVTFARPRQPGLDQYSFTTPFIVAATPSAFAFAPSPVLFAAPVAASLQAASGSPGWFLFPTQQVVTATPPPIPHFIADMGSMMVH